MRSKSKARKLTQDDKAAYKAAVTAAAAAHARQEEEAGEVILAEQQATVTSSTSESPPPPPEPQPQPQPPKSPPAAAAPPCQPQPSVSQPTFPPRPTNLTLPNFLISFEKNQFQPIRETCSEPGGEQGGAEMRSDHLPVHIAEDIQVPEDFELRESSVCPGLGVWTRVLIPLGHKVGPFQGVMKPNVDDPSCAWELVDKVGRVLGWLDASEAGTGNWMKYVRSSEHLLQRNMMAVQVDEQVFYKAVRDIRPGEEMLLYARDALYPEMELEAMAMHKLEEENQAYPCGDCGEVFRSKVALRRHQTYACPNSQTSFIRKMTLDTSQDRVDSDGKSMDSETSGVEQELGTEGEYKCDQCPKSFQWKSNLVRHQVTHDEDRRYPCENCDKVFTDPSNLQRHIRSQHVGARCHACSECGKTFATSSGLKQHQHIHSSVKPFQCEVCLKAYTQFSNLCRHKRMHADCRQQIKCKDCGQAFSTVTSLSKHKRFCEGALRSGMRLCYSQDKLNPMALSPGSQPPPFNPALMNLYGPRPPYPFFPPLGSAFPVLQPALPHGILGGSPMSPSSTPLGASGLLEKLSPDSGVSPDVKRELRHKLKEEAGGESDQDFRESGSEDDRAHSPSKRPRVELEPGEIRSFSPRRSPLASPMKLPLKPSLLPQPATTTSPPTSQLPTSTGDLPFDLSRPVKKQEPRSPSPQPEPRSTDSAPGSGKASPAKDELPLDLSKKAPPAEVTFPSEMARKTHIYGEAARSPVVPEPKYPFSTSAPYPFPPPTSLVESMLRLDKEKMAQSQLLQQDLAKFMGFPRFPIPGLPPPFGGMNPLGLLRPDMDKALSSPILKMDKGPSASSPSHVFPFSSPVVSGAGGPSNKLKERYACKFCGKIFPRSANLTRHLRTHTGEQPYKCKYCERSFSISSNLQRHVRNIHNKEKPFRCPLCDRSFGQQTNLDRHLKKHEQEGPNVADSPTPEMDGKDDAYFAQIRSFLAKDPTLLGEHAPESDLMNDSLPKKDLSDIEDGKESDLTIVDDEIDEEIDPLSDEAEGGVEREIEGEESGQEEELNLSTKDRENGADSPTPSLSNNNKDSPAKSAMVNGFHETPECDREEEDADTTNYEADSAFQPLACST